MSAFWEFLANSRDRASPLERVYRWFLQWPEALAYPTRISKGEIARALALDSSVVVEALSTLIDAGYIVVEAGDMEDWLWVTLPFNLPDQIQALSVREPRKPPIPEAERRTVGLRLRWRVLERDGHRCRGCGAKVEDGAKLVVDHVKPFSKGGPTTEENLQTLCHECNMGKANIYLESA